MIGTLGTSILFEVSDQKVLTFTGMTRNVSGNWATHSRIGKKARSEFLGPNLQALSFSISLNAVFGVKPRRILIAIEKMVEDGTAEYFVVGGRTVGSNPWKITASSETWDTVLNKGELLKATLSLTLEEYV